MRRTGFTLVEMLVVVSIVVVISTIVLAYFPGFSTSTAVAGMAERIALSVRQAQTYALNSKQSVEEPGNFDIAYGVNFNASRPNTFVLFGDLDNDGAWNPASDESIYDFNSGRALITDLCLHIDSTSPPECVSDGVDEVNIFFKEPLLSANINSNIGGPYAYAEIKVSSVSASNYEKIIFVWATGHVYVNP